MGRLLAVVPMLLCLILPGQPASCTTMGTAMLMSIGTPVSVTGVVTYLDTNECYIEDQHRACGMWVEGKIDGINIGNLVTVSGNLSVIDGEYGVRNARFASITQGTEIQPLFMTNKNLGFPPIKTGEGVWDYNQVLINSVKTWKWIPRLGLKTIGLLVTTTGIVTARYYSPVNGETWFFIDDGTSASADLGDKGVLVYSDAVVNEGDYVKVTGISSVERSYDHSARLLRVIRPRDAGDVEVIKDKPSYGLCSYEFDEKEEDRQWSIYPGVGSISTDIMPGWLTFSPESVPNKKYPMQYIQIIPPTHWEMNTKIKFDFSPDIVVQHLCIVLRKSAKMLLPYDQRYTEDMPLLTVTNKSCGGQPSSYIYANRNQIPSEANYCYLRVRNLNFGDGSTVSISFDGKEYIESKMTPPPSGYPSAYLYLCIYGQYEPKSLPAMPFRAHFDYIRFTELPNAGGVE